MALREKRSSVSWDVLEPGAVGDSRTLAGLLRRKRRAGEDPGSVPLRTLGTQGVTRTPARDAAGASGRESCARDSCGIQTRCFFCLLCTNLEESARVRGLEQAQRTRLAILETPVFICSYLSLVSSQEFVICLFWEELRQEKKAIYPTVQEESLGSTWH